MINNFSLFIFTSLLAVAVASPKTKKNEHHLSDSSSTSKKQNILEYVDQIVKGDQSVLDAYVKFAIAVEHNIGLVCPTDKAPNNDRGDLAENVQVTLFPSPYPREAYQKAVDLQEALNLLFFRIASDYQYLIDAHQDVIETDDHVRGLINILEEAKREGIRQPYTLMVQRTDYLLNVVKDEQMGGETDYELIQLEVNAGTCTRALAWKRNTTELHRQVLRRAGMNSDNVPENNPDKQFVLALHMAWKKFNNKDAIIVILTNEKIYEYDQRYLEDQMARVSNGQIKFDYIALEEGEKRMTLDANSNLLLDGRLVGLVISEASTLGYVTNEKEMEVRRKIELSTAVKSPSVAIAMSVSKKIQQLLTMPGEVERFLPDNLRMAAEIRKTFTELWGLENNDEKTQRIIDDAIRFPDKYVMKPTREGGFSNFFGKEISDNLKKFSHAQRKAFILQKKINTLTLPNYRMKTNQPVKREMVVPELGIFGFLLGNVDTDEVPYNVQDGYFMRAKPSHSNNGYGEFVGDSPFLF